MSDRLIRRDRYYIRRPQAHPYEKPGIWPDLRTALFDVALVGLFFIGLILALYWLWTL